MRKTTTTSTYEITRHDLLDNFGIPGEGVITVKCLASVSDLDEPAIEITLTKSGEESS